MPDAANNSLALAVHDLTTLKQDWVRIFEDFSFFQTLFLFAFFAGKYHWLVYKHIHLLNEDAVSWDLIASLQEYNISDDNLTSEYLLASALLPSEHGRPLVKYLFL